MSLLPLLYSNWWEDLDHPHRLVDQHFGHGIHPEHLPSHGERRHLSPFLLPKLSREGRSNCPVNIYIRPWGDALSQNERGVSTVKADKDQFQVSLDVQQFAPEEIDVKIVDRTVVVEGKHEEKQDEHGWVSRQFCRRYMIPEQCDIEQVTSKLSSDGVLSITAPRKDKPKVEGERSIKVHYTGKPAIRENGDAKPAQSSDAQKNESEIV